jgi:hypothetical protein
MRLLLPVAAVLVVFAACGGSSSPSPAETSIPSVDTDAVPAETTTASTTPTPLSELPAIPVGPLSDFPDSIQGAASGLDRMQFDTGVAAIAPQILPFPFSWSFSFTNPPVPLEFSREPSYAYLLAGVPIDDASPPSDVVFELAVGVLGPLEVPGGPVLFEQLGFAIEPTLAPINLESDGAAPIYRFDSGFGMTLVFSDGRYYVSLTVTDDCEANDQDRMTGGTTCIAWDDLQMLLDSLAVIDPATLS